MMHRPRSAATAGLAGLLFLSACCCPPPSGDAKVEQAQQLYAEGDLEGAIARFEEALTLPLNDHSRSEVLTSIGNCYNQLNEFERSLEYHERALEEDPRSYEAYVNKGVTHRLLGEYDQAEQMYAKALELEPEYAELHASIGALALHQGEVATAIEHLEYAIELDDTLAISHSNLAMAYAMDDRFDEADTELRKAVLRGYENSEMAQQRIDQLRALAERQ